MVGLKFIGFRSGLRVRVIIYIYIHIHIYIYTYTYIYIYSLLGTCYPNIGRLYSC